MRIAIALTVVPTLVAFAVAACGGKQEDPPLTTIDPGTYAASDAAVCIVAASLVDPDGGAARGTCEQDKTGTGCKEFEYEVQCTGDGVINASLPCEEIDSANRLFCCTCGP